MKVSKAKEKVCPFIESSLPNNEETNYAQSPANINCICGDCMAFVFTRETESRNNQIIKVLDDDDKEGYCKRLSND